MCAQSLEKCPGSIQATLEVIGDKWTALIIRDLSAAPARFCDLENSLEGISPRTLSQRLDKLEMAGIIDKCLYCERPPRNDYRLTAKGAELQSILIQMADWGARYTAA